MDRLESCCNLGVSHVEVLCLADNLQALSVSSYAH
jgi:hypothetical protein